jgi:uncharacterized pyridoxal phosphate-containing UPF0001 family protein
MTSIAANLQAVRERIATACRAAGRREDSVSLLAVSKTWPAADLRQAAVAGQAAFGENYVQEAVDKIAALRGLGLASNGTSSAPCKATRRASSRRTSTGCIPWTA